MKRRTVGWLAFAAVCAAVVGFAPDSDVVVTPSARRTAVPSSSATSTLPVAVSQPPRLANPGYLAPAPEKLADAVGGLLPSVAPSDGGVATAPAKSEPASPSGPELKAFGRIRVADRWLVSLALGDEEGLTEVDGRFAGRFHVVQIESDHVVVRTEPDGKQSIVSFAEAR